MRQLIISLLLIFSSITFQGYSQQLVYDFNKGEYVQGELIQSNGKVVPVMSGSFATIKVINVNTFRFNVTISGRSIQYVTQMPSELQSLFRTPVGASAKSVTEGTNDIKTAVERINGKLAEAIVRDNEKGTLLRNLNANLLLVKKRYKQQFAAASKSKRDKDENELFLVRERQLYIDAQEKTAAAEEEYLKISDFQQVLQELVSAAEVYGVTSGRIAALKMRKSELITLCRQDWESHDKMLEQLPAPIAKDDMRADFKEFAEYFATLQALCTKAYIKAVNDDDRKILTDTKKLIEDGHKKISEGDLLKLIEDLDLLQTTLENPKTFTVVSPPIQIDGDYVAFNVQAQPTRSTDLMNFLPGKEISVEIPVKGGMKIDFSVGPTLSFGRKARDELYFTEAAGKDDTKEDSLVFRQRSNNNAISPGLAAMVHISRRSGKNLAGGFMFGIGAGFKDSARIDVNLFLGGSLVAGKREKVMLSAGIGFLRVARLKTTEYEPGKIYPAAKTNLSDITERVFKPSFFIALSYNLTTRQDIR